MKLINYLVLFACFTACIVILSSCTTVNTVDREIPIGTKQMIADKRIITDSTLNNKVRIISLNESTTTGGFLQVQVEVLNQKNSMQSFNYRFEWLDMNSMLINTPTSIWIPRQIEGQETLSITAVAPTTTAKDFQVKFIENVRKD